MIGLDRDNIQNEKFSDDEEEIWRDIDGYDKYMVSSKGRVINKASGKILKPSVEGSGYKSVFYAIMKVKLSRKFIDLSPKHS